MVAQVTLCLETSNYQPNIFFLNQKEILNPPTILIKIIHEQKKYQVTCVQGGRGGEGVEKQKDWPSFFPCYC